MLYHVLRLNLHVCQLIVTSYAGLRDIAAHLDPVLVAAIQDVLRVRMLHDEAFSAIGDDIVHALSDVLSCTTFELGHKLDPPRNFFQAGAQVALAKLQRLVKQRHTVQVEEVEHFDCKEIM